MIDVLHRNNTVCYITVHKLLHKYTTFNSSPRSHFLHIWTLESKKLLRIIDLPTKVRVVKHLEFLTDSFDGGSSQVMYILIYTVQLHVALCLY